MAVRLQNTNLVYFPVPKIACTSLKTAILYHNDPLLYERIVAGTYATRPRHVHDIYPSSRISLFRPKGKRFCLVRDPLKRFVSGYRNRIIHHRNLGNHPPDINEFAANLAYHMGRNRAVRHHFSPMTVFLGRNPSIFDRVFDISEIPKLIEYVAFEGISLKVPHTQDGGPKMSVNDLNQESINSLREFYAEDYRVWEAYFRQ